MSPSPTKAWTAISSSWSRHCRAGSLAEATQPSAGLEACDRSRDSCRSAAAMPVEAGGSLLRRGRCFRRSRRTGGRLRTRRLRGGARRFGILKSVPVSTSGENMRADAIHAEQAARPAGAHVIGDSGSNCRHRRARSCRRALLGDALRGRPGSGSVTRSDLLAGEGELAGLVAMAVLIDDTTDRSG